MTPVEATGIYGSDNVCPLEDLVHILNLYETRSVKKTCRYRSCRIEYTSKGRVVHHIFGGFCGAFWVRLRG